MRVDARVQGGRALSAWLRRAIAGSASMFVAAVFAVMTVQCLVWRWPSVPPGTAGVSAQQDADKGLSGVPEVRHG
jgi:hypothetical protein